jgi:ABC-type sugar transport system ATPase subunit
MGGVVLGVRHLSNAALGIRDVSLEVRAGEILGVAGLVGAGRTELAETLFGLSPATGGEISIRGERVRIKSPGDAIRCGIAYLPEDRPRHGVVPEMDVAANITLATLRSVARRGLIDRAAERASARRYIDRLRIKTPSASTSVQHLSGGNQQKVAFARWLEAGPAVLILDEPTQGVDVGSKAEIHDLIQHLAEQGLAIVMISSELPEILGMSDRVAVMHGGTIVAILARADATQERILDHALGHESATAPR